MARSLSADLRSSSLSSSSSSLASSLGAAATVTTGASGSSSGGGMRRARESAENGAASGRAAAGGVSPLGLRVLTLLRDVVAQVDAEPGVLRWAHRSGNGPAVVDAVCSAVVKPGVAALASEPACAAAARLSFAALLTAVARAVPVAPASNPSFVGAALLLIEACGAFEHGGHDTNARGQAQELPSLPHASASSPRGGGRPRGGGAVAASAAAVAEDATACAVIDDIAAAAVRILDRTVDSDAWDAGVVVASCVAGTGRRSSSVGDKERHGGERAQRFAARLTSCLASVALTHAFLACNGDASGSGSGNYPGSGDGSGRRARGSTGTTRSLFTSAAPSSSSGGASSPVALFSELNGWLAVASTLTAASESRDAIAPSPSSSSPLSRSASWDPVGPALTLLEVVVGDAGHDHSCGVAPRDMPGVATLARAAVQLLAVAVARAASADPTDRANASQRVQSLLRAIMTLSRAVPLASLLGATELTSVADSLRACLAQWRRHVEAPRTSATEDPGEKGDTAAAAAASTDLVSLGACAATALLTAPRADRRVLVHAGARRACLGGGGGGEADLAASGDGADGSDHESADSDEETLGSCRRARAAAANASGAVGGEPVTAASEAAEAMFALRRGSTAVGRNVAAAYAAALLVTLSLGCASARLAVLRCIVAAARLHGGEAQVGASPMAYPVAVLQEFILFQSANQVLTRDTLVALHRLIERAVAENGIETTVVGDA
jgi:hypothetical protein